MELFPIFESAVHGLGVYRPVLHTGGTMDRQLSRCVRLITALTIFVPAVFFAAPPAVAAVSVSDQIAALGLPESSITWTVDEFAAFLNTSIAHGEPAQKLLAQKILAALHEKNITLANGQLVYEGSFGSPSTGEIQGIPTLETCTEVVINNLTGRVIADGSTFTLRVSGFPGTVVLDATLVGKATASGDLEIKGYLLVPEVVGVDCGWYGNFFTGYYYACVPRIELRCISPVTVATSQVSATVLNVETRLRLTINLSATLNANILTVQRDANLSGQLISASSPFLDGVVDVLISLDPVYFFASDWAKGKVKDAVKGAYQKWLDDENTKARTAINGTTTVTLPDLGNDTASLLSLVESANIPGHLIDLISRENRRYELLFCLLTNQGSCTTTFLASIAACDFTRRSFLASMSVPALYTVSNGACLAADPAGPDTGQYFADPSCQPQNQIAYRPPSYDAFCAETLTFVGPNPSLGNASWAPDVNQVNDRLPASVPARMWSLSYGTQLKAAIDTGSQVPFMKRVNYRTISNTGRGSGTCQLEMRVYKKDAVASNLKPLLAMHGGSWAYRGFAFSGLEAQVSQFTDRGYVVFAPFYRLSGEADGNIECNGAIWSDVISDVETALSWVRQYGPALGAQAGADGRSIPVAVWGQSAGAQLSAYLAVYHPSDVSRGLLLYPPVDAQDFLNNYQATFPRAAGILKRFCGAVNDQPDPICVTQNSLYALVNDRTPPLFMIHGTGDTIVPYQQSSGMCSRYGNTAVAGTTVAPGTYDCGRMSELRLVAGAEHALDAFCIPDVFCPAGAGNVDTVKNYLSEGRKWLDNDMSWLIPILNLLLDD